MNTTHSQYLDLNLIMKRIIGQIIAAYAEVMEKNLAYFQPRSFIKILSKINKDPNLQKDSLDQPTLMKL